jgi:hypothetical protein
MQSGEYILVRFMKIKKVGNENLPHSANYLMMNIPVFLLKENEIVLLSTFEKKKKRGRLLLLELKKVTKKSLF